LIRTLPDHIQDHIQEAALSSKAAGEQVAEDPPPMPVVIVPGFHARQLTQELVRSLPPFIQPYIIEAFPADPIAVLNEITQTFGTPHAAKKDLKESRPAGLIAIGFSAGVVGLAGALTLWQQQGGQVSRFFAIDGWGVPIVGLPLCRLSHDYFTHWSSQLLGAGEVSFYADPPVAHLEMWGEASRVVGRQVKGRQVKATERKTNELNERCDESMTMAAFLRQQLIAQRDKRAKQSI
jgi:hypothetical protein